MIKEAIIKRLEEAGWKMKGVMPNDSSWFKNEKQVNIIGDKYVNLYLDGNHAGMIESMKMLNKKDRLLDYFIVH